MVYDIVVVWGCAAELTGTDVADLPTSNTVMDYFNKLYKMIPPKLSLDKNCEKCLTVKFTDGASSDLYTMPYPDNLYWARRVRKALSKIIRIKPHTDRFIYIKREENKE